MWLFANPSSSCRQRKVVQCGIAIKKRVVIDNISVSLCFDENSSKLESGVEKMTMLLMESRLLEENLSLVRRRRWTPKLRSRQLKYKSKS